MALFAFGGDPPLGSGGTGPIPVIRDVARQISPSDAPPTQTAPPPVGSISGIIAAGLPSAEQLAAAVIEQRRAAEVAAGQGRPDVSRADP